jgi:hypothetical protein
MLWQILNLMKKEQNCLNVPPGMNPSSKAIQSQRDNAGFHLTETIVPDVHIRTNAIQYPKELPP